MIKRKTAFGQWTLVRRISEGHSSYVWRAVGADGRLAAIKLLKRGYLRIPRLYDRVKNEIDAMNKCADIPGVLPLWDSATPQDPRRDGDAWLVFPLAVPLSRNRDVSVDDAVRICASLAATLTAMHARGFYHRDIKPENIFLWQGMWHLGDFGIALGPESFRHTQEGEKVGPIHYIAPEMLNNAVASGGGPADVYSLAKLLWVLSTGQKYPVPGWQFDHPALTVSGYVHDPRVHTLDTLIEAATHVEPHRRPVMAAVAKTLAAWFEPVREQANELDLTPVKKDIEALVAPIQSEERRRIQAEDRAHRHIEGFFWPFRSVIGDIWKALQGAGIYDITLHDMAGGNDHFCRDTSGQRRRDSERERHWYFEYSPEAVLRHERKRAHMFVGANLVLPRLEGTTTPDIYSTVVGAAGYWLELHVHDGSQWHQSSRPLWGASEEFLLGSPDSEKAQKRFVIGLTANLYPSVQALGKVFRDGQLAEWITEQTDS